jgi:hypothetical protein
MEMQKVQSSLIAAIAYNALEQKLFVEFHKSKKQEENPVYCYHPFSQEQWDEFSEAESIGKYFLAKVKLDFRLTTTKVEKEKKEEVA